jgi:MFS family permease
MSPSRPSLEVVDRSAPVAPQVGSLIWLLGLGAFGLAWSITTVAAYVPPVLEKFTSSTTLIGLVLAAEGAFAILLPLLVGPVSDATQTTLGRRRPLMLLALLPMAVTLALVAFMDTLPATALALFGFFFAYYIYEPPYRGLYPDLLPESVFGRAQGAQHVLRGLALGGALVSGGFLLAVWEPFPFVLAAGVTLLTCGAVVVFAREDASASRQYERLRSFFAAPWRIVRRDKHVRRFLIANTAWEATFAGMRTFVVLYIIVGLDQPLYVSSIVLAVVAGGYVLAAAASGWFGDHFGIGRVILGASVVYGFGLLAAGFAQAWHTWFYALIFPVAVAGGTVMTLSWALLFKVMPSTDHGAVAGLATTTKGFGLLIGPLAVGAAIDIFRPFLEETEGYAAVWPVCAIPVLAAIPLVALLADAESRGFRSRPPVT